MIANDIGLLKGTISGDTSSFNTLQVITGIHATRGLLDSLNGLTYIYDPNWLPDSEGHTLPFAFFNIKDIKENQESEVSTKKVIVYTDGDSRQGNQGIAPAAVHVVADNVVAKPKTYTISALVPFTSITRTPDILQKMQLDINSFLSVYASDFAGGTFMNVVDTALNIIVPLVRMFETTVQSKIGVTPEYNKTSLQKMAERRAIVKFKNWNTWETKSVVVKSLEFSKVGTMDDYYECQMTLQEMPLLVVTNKKYKVTYKEDWWSRKMAKYLSTLVDKLSSTMATYNKIKGFV